MKNGNSILHNEPDQYSWGKIMCSSRCQGSHSQVCNCECNGLFHGIRQYSSYEAYSEGLNVQFPPCTPVRFNKLTKRGTLKGSVKRFGHRGGLSAYVELKTGEVTNIYNISTIGEKESEKHIKNKR